MKLQKQCYLLVSFTSRQDYIKQSSFKTRQNQPYVSLENSLLTPFDLVLYFIQKPISIWNAALSWNGLLK